MELWEEANKVISKVPYTEKSHREVLRIQELAYRELDAMEENLQFKHELEVLAK